MNGKYSTILLTAAMLVAVALGGMYAGSAQAQDAASEPAEAQPADEATLIETLTGDAEWADKHMACRQLRQIGTTQSIPALAALLPDPELSHMARYALEAMPYPKAGQVLRDALTATEGPVCCGIATSLGVRRDAKAVPLLAPLVTGADADVARAAAGALGRIATPDAAKALLAVRGAIPAAIRPALGEGLLAAAGGLAEAGKGDQAAQIFLELLTPGWPTQIRTGAFRGLAYAQPDQAPPRLITALCGCGLFRGIAAQIIAEQSGAETTKLYADALSNLPPSGQAALLWGLADRGDLAARPAVAQALQSADPEVKLAAAKALSALGTVDDVPALTALLASEDEALAEAAQVTLTTSKAEGMTEAVIGQIASASPGVYAMLLEILTNRRAEQVVSLSVEALANGDVIVRNAGLRVLSLLGSAGQVDPVLAIAAKATDSSERAAAEKALGAICSREGEGVLASVLGAMNGASAEVRVTLLRAVSRVNSAKALEAVVAASNDADETVRGEGARLLAEWPTPDAMPHLRTLAQDEDLSRYVLGFRGYVRLAQAAATADEKNTLLDEAFGLARRPEEKKAVLAAWGKLNTGRSIDALLPQLDDPAVQNEAAMALISVAEGVSTHSEPAKKRAIQVLNIVIEKAADANVKEKAKKVLAQIGG